MLSHHWYENTQLINWFQFVLACFYGALLGYERETQGKPAGIKTHAFVSGASCLFVVLSISIARQFADAMGPDLVNVDPIRIIQSIILGVSFIGAGTIIKDKSDRVHGLTTAASLLLVVAIGIGVGLGR